MAKKRIRAPGLLDIFISAPIDPQGTMADLLVTPKYPPHLITCLFCVCCIVIAPPILYTPDGTLNTTHINLLAATLSTSLLTLGLAGFFQSMLTRTLGTQQSIFSLFCAMTYALTPFVTVMIFFYAATYLTQGHISILQYLTTGFVSQSDRLAPFFPTMVKASGLVSFVLFTNGIRVLMRSSLISAALIATVCLPLIMGSFIVSLSIEELLLPGISPKVIEVFTSFMGHSHGTID
jgi:hypothetical protein